MSDDAPDRSSSGRSGADDSPRSDADDVDAGRRRSHGVGGERQGDDRDATTRRRDDSHRRGERSGNADAGHQRAAVPDPSAGPGAAIRWFLQTRDPRVAFVREVASSVLVVAVVGLVLFAVSGVWPPMVAVESGSMEPNMHPGDLVLVFDEGRFVPDAAYGDTGVVTYRDGVAADYWQFGSYGDVVVFAPPSRSGPPIIHRARFWVAEDENWFPKANRSYVSATRCGDSPDEGLRNCPAPNAGFVTKGDANAHYDQANGLAPPVRPEWIRGTAEVRVPYLGCVRLWFSGNPPPNCRP